MAFCVLYDTYREAGLGLKIEGVTVEADGEFDDVWRSTGITHSVTVDTQAPAEDVAHLHAVVDEVAEVPRALRAGAKVIHQR